MVVCIRARGTPVPAPGSPWLPVQCCVQALALKPVVNSASVRWWEKDFPGQPFLPPAPCWPVSCLPGRDLCAPWCRAGWRRGQCVWLAGTWQAALWFALERARPCTRQLCPRKRLAVSGDVLVVTLRCSWWGELGCPLHIPHAWDTRSRRQRCSRERPRELALHAGPW